MKKSPNLQIISKQRPKSQLLDDRLLASLEVANFSDLGSVEQKRVERMMSAVNPGAGIVGVAVLPRSWDLRPIVVVPEEAQNGPSIIRFLGPEVTLSLNLTARITDVLKRISAAREASARLAQWGVLEGQIWYRRSLAVSTLAERLMEPEPVSPQDAMNIAQKLTAIVRQWHTLGIIHGHIAPSNISVSSNGEVSLLDPGVGLAIVQANRALGMEEFAAGYERASFAPESVDSELVNYDVDVFGLGQVFWALFGRVQREKLERVEELRSLILAMTQEDPSARPRLDYVEQVLKGRFSRKDTNVRGKKVRPSSTAHRQLLSGENEASEGAAWEPRETVSAETRPEQSFPSTPERATVTSYGQTVTEPDEWRSAPGIAPVEEEPGEQKPAAKREGPQNEVNLGRSNLVFYIILVVLCTFIGFQIAKQFGGPEAEPMSEREMELAWESMTPSQMLPVARATVDENYPSMFAQRLVLRSSFDGRRLSPLVNHGLIRIAFDPKWEMQLTAKDRQAALVLGLAKLLGNEAPKLDIDPQQLHPGVLLGILSTVPNVKAVANIPAVSLTRLPPPFGFAFNELVAARQDLSSADPAVMMLAKLGTQGPGGVGEVIEYLKHDPAVRLRSLAYMYSDDPKLARASLMLLLNHPNVQLNHELDVWGRAVKLLDWNDLDANDLLFILAGLPPARQPGPQAIVQMLAHPSAAVRQYAIGKTLDEIPLAHPGKLAVLTTLKEKPELLTAKQTLELARFLESPDRATGESIRGWLDSGPAKEILIALLLGTSKQQHATKFDSEISNYLQKTGWEPAEAELRQLIFHPDRLTRVFAYVRVSSLPDHKSAISLLESARAREGAEDLKQHLDLLIGSLKLG